MPCRKASQHRAIRRRLRGTLLHGGGGARARDAVRRLAAIRKLEDRLGVKLFSRDPGQVTPTPAGEAYYERCVELLRRERRGDAVRASPRPHGRDPVGLMPTMTRCALAPALSRFIDEHPNVVVRSSKAYSAVLTQQVRAGELDFAIVPAFPGSPGMSSRHVPAHHRGAGLAARLAARTISPRCASAISGR